MKKIVEIKWDILPENYEEFLNEAKEKLYDAETAAALFICALRIYMADRKEGTKCINLMCFGNQGDTPMYFPRLQQIAASQKYLPETYFKDSVPENDYTNSSNTVVIESDNKLGLRRDSKTVYVGCGGSGNFRPITLRKYSDDKIHKLYGELKPQNDMWFVSDFISILLDVKPPMGDAK